MEKIAIDIALFPEKSVEIIARVYNNNLSGVINKTYPKFQLANSEKEGCFPHITLAQGFFEKNSIEKVSSLIEKITNSYSPLDLRISNAYESTFPNGLKGIGLAVEDNAVINSLHSDIMKELEPYTSYEGDSSALYKRKGENFDDISLYWIVNFKDRAFNKFEPHITLGIGELKPFLPLEFNASEIVLAQLGNYCTCRKILFSTNLKDQY